MITLFILRHGKSEGNEKKIIQGLNNQYALSEKGKHDTECVAKKYKQQLNMVDVAYCSNLLRAEQTAQILLQESGKTRLVQKTELLNEMNPGVLSDMTHMDAQEMYPEYYKVWCDRKDLDLIEGAEKGNELQSRCLAFLENFLEIEEGTYLVVTHAGYLRCLVNTIAGRDRTTPVNIDNLNIHVVKNPWQNVKCRCLKKDTGKAVYDIETFNERYILKRVNKKMSRWDYQISIIQNKVSKEIGYIPQAYWYGDKIDNNNNAYTVKVLKYMRGEPKKENSYICFEDIKTVFEKVHNVHRHYNKYAMNLSENDRCIYRKVATYAEKCKNEKAKKIGQAILEDVVFQALCNGEQKLVLYDVHRMNIVFEQKEISLIDLDSVLYAPADYQAACFIGAYCMFSNFLDSEQQYRRLFAYCEELGYSTENIKFLLLIRIYTGLCYFELVEDRSQEDTRNLERYWSLLKEVCEYLKNDNSNLAKIILNIVVS